MIIKKIITMGLISVAAVSVMGVPVFADDNNTSIDFNNYKEIIVDEVAALTGIDVEDFEIVQLESMSRTRTSTEETTCLRIKKEENSIINDRIIIPQIAVDDTLENSFSYVETQLKRRDSHLSATYLVDLVLNFSCYYESGKYYTNDDSYYETLFTPKSLYFSWKSNTSNTKINNIDVVWDAKGIYYQISPIKNLGYEKYVKFEVKKSSPVQGTSYGDWAQAMDSNHGIACVDYFSHGSILYFDLNYTVNGKSKSNTHSYNIFGV